MFKPLMLLIVYIGLTNPTFGNTKIKILSWWNFLSPQTIQNLRQQGFQSEIVSYMTNENAIAKIASNNDSFDIVIISGIVADLMSKKQKISLVDIQTPLKRNYYPFLNKFKHCLPFLWSSTVFISHTSENLELDGMQKLLELKKKSFKIGIVTDPQEFFFRILLDNNRNKFSQIDQSLMDKYSAVNSKDFSSELTTILQDEKSAAYGWSGEAGELIRQGKKLSLSLARSYPVMGADYLCIAYQGKDNSRFQKIVEYMKNFTDIKNTAISVKFSNYFPPYVNNTTGLQKNYVDLLNESLIQIKKGNFFMIPATNDNDYHLLNPFWRKVRFH